MGSRKLDAREVAREKFINGARNAEIRSTTEKILTNIESAMEKKERKTKVQVISCVHGDIREQGVPGDEIRDREQMEGKVRIIQPI